jgi:hypothetical protein
MGPELSSNNIHGPGFRLVLTSTANHPDRAKRVALSFRLQWQPNTELGLDPRKRIEQQWEVE